MDHYKLTVYRSNSCNNSSNQSELTWIELLDMVEQKSHIFIFTPGEYSSFFGGCGIFRKNNCIPDDVYPAADISLTEKAYIEMVKEGNWLHNQFLIYDDGTDLPLAHYS